MTEAAKHSAEPARTVPAPLPPLPPDVSIERVRDRFDGQDSRDIFAKVVEFTLIERAQALGVYPFFQPLDNNDGPEAQIHGRRVLMFGSNNYLGLTRHPHVVEAAREAITRYGTSMTGSRLLNGSILLHEELEGRIARFLRKDAALVFTTGYQTNLGTISALVDKRSVAVVDKLDHASIYDGAQLADGEILRFKHNDARHLDTVLARIPQHKAVLVIVDGVYSMGGDIADLPAIVDVCARHGARLFVDDAHAIGVIGEGGRGTASHFGLEDRVDLVMGTFSKSLASIGGFVAGPRKVLEWIKHFGRSMMFSASLPPSCTAAALAALDVIENEPEIVERLQKLGTLWREGLSSLGFAVGNSQTPIVPVQLGDEYTTVVFWRELLENGVYTNPVIYPAVNMKEGILRTSCMATHTEEQIAQALEVFRDVGRKQGHIS
ncbi:MAG: pyridoxal phosphate-dependent aminotransferase family protein [Dehalococcoidia bacterium]|nr:pyridoxal phosphate-dependent aminotransferase family protein [Dehalococcoidia bacterium]